MKNNLKTVRGIKGLTQEELAQLLGVSRQTIISIESSRYVPSTVLSLKISKILGKSIEELFELENSDYDLKSNKSS
jgi:putative transcriptional regulator